MNVFISLKRLMIVLSGCLWFTACSKEEPEPASTSLDLGVAPNYEVVFDSEFDFKLLKDQGINRVNLYYQWKEFETGFDFPGDTTDWKAEIVPVIDQLRSLQMKASFILEITDTDCSEDDPKTCWLEYGMPSDLSFNGFDREPFQSRLLSFVLRTIQKLDREVITHFFLGNEGDQFLRLYPEYEEGHFKMMQKLQDTLATIKNRPKFGTIFTFDITFPGFNDLAKTLAQEIEVMAFTMYPTLSAYAYVEPDKKMVEEWLGEALQITGGKPLVITETGYPATAPLGSAKAQESYTRLLVQYLREHQSDIDFVSWWSLWDSPTHPDAFFNHTGLLTFDNRKRPAFDIWVGPAIL